VIVVCHCVAGGKYVVATLALLVGYAMLALFAVIFVPGIGCMGAYRVGPVCISYGIMYEFAYDSVVVVSLSAGVLMRTSASTKVKASRASTDSTAKESMMGFVLSLHLYLYSFDGLAKCLKSENKGRCQGGLPLSREETLIFESRQIQLTERRHQGAELVARNVHGTSSAPTRASESTPPTYALGTASLVSFNRMSLSHRDSQSTL
jgi:hypothetical protein